ncbi:hypothetical protein, partial [Streptomyces sp. NPDC058605]|uniref:hypothetical protein n=1 Tax=Streptomyces sp. NPDC058605 TaxID=3346552 RepID=UPI0036467E1E
MTVAVTVIVPRSPQGCRDADQFHRSLPPVSPSPSPVIADPILSVSAADEVARFEITFHEPPDH